jgi:hypothetical protein
VAFVRERQLGGGSIAVRRVRRLVTNQRIDA